MTVSFSLMLVTAKFGINSFMPSETHASERTMKLTVYLLQICSKLREMYSLIDMLHMLHRVNFIL